ncbi:heavy-metal-associated domain-containing protein [Rhodocytophaga rosea]|uniref:Heavy-metal-associated domain-containing protein n=1 Tax=Rhodocytophaga rosea TaxID=2704465 RepID=A0A6C0GDK0_9BACT|nr:heavy metal-associated domain-containing protein [Rhodocytophaga rosea]QHT65842.1 heavy-metal-associated domain-containing protein [Rhodocytophaga rosea]
MKKAAVIIALFISSISLGFAQDSKMEEVKIKTSSVCKMCKNTLEKSLSFEKGIKNSNLDVPSQVITVSYNPKKTDINKIKKAINETGYDADELPADQKAYNKLEDCCKKDKPVHVD